MKKPEALYKFKRAMDRLNMPERTRDSYSRFFGRFFDYYAQHQDKPVKENIDNFILTLKFRGTPYSTANLYICALRKFYKLVPTKEKIDIPDIPYMKKERKLPRIYSRDEVIKMFAVKMNPKHRLLLALVYGCGLRVSEVVAIRNRDIFLDSNFIRIAGKGRKERIVPVKNEAIPHELIRTFMGHGEYLFPGQKTGHLSDRSAQKIFGDTVLKAGIDKRAGIHGLRHSYATHSIERGTDLFSINKVLGHASLKTTAIYLHTSNAFLADIKSPMEGII